MILITGATGQLGTSVVNQLLTKLSTDQFVVTSSNERGVQSLINKGLHARLANFSDIETLNDAFEGIDTLLLISTMDPNRLEQHKNVIDAAKAKGVQHIVYTSLAIKDIEISAVKELMISHFETEAYIKSSGLKYTILRNTMYAEALTQILGPNALTQSIQLPGGTGKVPYALRREMGEATANLLLQAPKANAIYNITGDTLYSYEDIAHTLKTFTTYPIEYENIDEVEFVENLKDMGFPDFAIYLHSGTLADIKHHQYEILDTTLSSLLGRAPADAATFLKEIFNINH